VRQLSLALKTWLQDRLPRPLSLGEQGERHAGRFLRRHGHRILACRRRYRYGEIDIIAVENQTIVFVEVKTRRSEQKGRPGEAVNHTRQQRLTRAALAYLKSHGLLEYPSRFDVIEVLWPANQRRPTIRHYRDAFPAAGKGQFYS